jgi:hypothetical protein
MNPLTLLAARVGSSLTGEIISTMPFVTRL